jgi:hypothetical protein
VGHVHDLALGTRLLDGHVHVLRPDHPTELIVLGDLHGCYGCLKAALLQSDFINRAWAHQWDPVEYPDVKLVLLGDYIDRGIYSFNGILRTVMQVFVTAPDHVYVLRGNHEYYLEYKGRIFGGVKPARRWRRSRRTCRPRCSRPTACCSRTCRRRSCATARRSSRRPAARRRFDARYRDQSTSTIPSCFRMWSDFAQVEAVAVEEQRQNARFSFWRAVSRVHERAGMTTMVRGHEQIERGFDVVYVSALILPTCSRRPTTTTTCRSAPTAASRRWRSRPSRARRGAARDAVAHDYQPITSTTASPGQPCSSTLHLAALSSGARRDGRPCPTATATARNPLQWRMADRCLAIATRVDGGGARDRVAGGWPFERASRVPAPGSPAARSCCG